MNEWGEEEDQIQCRNSCIWLTTHQWGEKSPVKNNHREKHTFTFLLILFFQSGLKAFDVIFEESLGGDGEADFASRAVNCRMTMRLACFSFKMIQSSVAIRCAIEMRRMGGFGGRFGYFTIGVVLIFPAESVYVGESSRVASPQSVFTFLKR